MCRLPLASGVRWPGSVPVLPIQRGVRPVLTRRLLTRRLLRSRRGRLCACGLCACGLCACGLCACGLCACGLCACGLCACGLCACGLCACGLCACGLCACGLCACGLCACGLCACGLCARLRARLWFMNGRNGAMRRRCGYAARGRSRRAHPRVCPLRQGPSPERGRCLGTGTVHPPAPNTAHSWGGAGREATMGRSYTGVCAPRRSGSPWPPLSCSCLPSSPLCLPARRSYPPRIGGRGVISFARIGGRGVIRRDGHRTQGRDGRGRRGGRRHGVRGRVDAQKQHDEGVDGQRCQDGSEEALTARHEHPPASPSPSPFRPEPARAAHPGRSRGRGRPGR